jgi:hypothetical protein
VTSDHPTLIVPGARSVEDWLIDDGQSCPKCGTSERLEVVGTRMDVGVFADKLSCGVCRFVFEREFHVATYTALEPGEPCEVCRDPQCPSPVYHEGRPSDYRNCEADGCHEQGPMPEFYKLFREFWYCADHAGEQLALAASERALTIDERRTAEELGVDGLPKGRRLDKEPERDATEWVNRDEGATDEDLIRITREQLARANASPSVRKLADALTVGDSALQEVCEGLLHEAGLDTYERGDEDALLIYEHLEGA